MTRDTLASRPVRVRCDDEVDELEAVYGLIAERFWTDGLPVIPPTEERIRRMLAGTNRAAREVVAVIPPLNAPATVEKVAINSVMAGCLPQYLPVVIAAVEAVAKPEFNLLAHNTSTTCSAPLLVINGPSRDRLGINYRESCFGPGGRANATIGRALRLVMMNVGGALPGNATKSVFGSPGRYTLCTGEWEERNPWAPLHVQMGLPRERDAATVQSCHTLQDIADAKCKTARGLLTVFAHSIDYIGQNHFADYVRISMDIGETLVVLCPDFANIIARDGYTLQDIREFLYEHTQPPIERWPEELREIIEAESGGRIVNGRVPLFARPDQFLVMVAGGLGGLHGLAAHGFDMSAAQTQPFKLP
jgi:hypothetical protein